MNAEFTINSDFFWFAEHVGEFTRGLEYRRFQFFAHEGRLTPLEQTGAGRWSIGALRCLNDKWRRLGDVITFDLLPTKEGGTLVRCYADETAPEGVTQYMIELLAGVAGAFPETLPALHPVLQQGAILLQRPGQLLTGEEAIGRAALVAHLENILTNGENGAQQAQGDGETAVNTVAGWALQLQPAGRRPDGTYDMAYQKLAAGENEIDVFKWVCNAFGWENPGKSERDSFKKAMKRRKDKIKT